MDMKIIENKRIPAVIKVIGAGGAGGNAVNRMIDCNIQGVEFIALNTDAQALNVRSKAPLKIYVGKDGQGAGGDPAKGEKAALEDKDKIIEAIKGADLLFIAAGMGGGTGTGSAPVIASLAKELGILTVAVVTKPFFYEGARIDIAEEGIEKLKGNVDSYIVIDNEKIMSMTDDDEILNDFAKVDDILRQAIQGIIAVIDNAGNINVDFADIEACLTEKGRVHLAIGRAEGQSGVVDATRNALENELLENSGIDGAKHVLVNVQAASKNLIRSKINEAMSSYIRAAVDPKAQVFWGFDANEEYGDEVSVTLMATGFVSEGSREDAKAEREIKETLQLNKVVNTAANFRSNVIEQPQIMQAAMAQATTQGMQPVPQGVQPATQATQFQMMQQPMQPMMVQTEGMSTVVKGESQAQDLYEKGEFITGSEWSKMNKTRQPQLPALQTKNAKEACEGQEEKRVDEFDFRLSSFPSDSDLEKPAIYRRRKR